MAYIVDCFVLIWCPFPNVDHVPISVVDPLWIGRKEWLARDAQRRIREFSDTLLLLAKASS